MNSSLVSFYDRTSRYINYKLGSLFGLGAGSIVFYINREHGFWPAAGGFGKQFLYNLLVGGFNLKTCERLSRKFDSRLLSLVSATIIPTAQAFAITYAIHNLGGTPESLESSTWQVYCNLPLFLVFGLGYRRKYEKDLEEIVETRGD